MGNLWILVHGTDAAQLAMTVQPMSFQKGTGGNTWDMNCADSDPGGIIRASFGFVKRHVKRRAVRTNHFL